MKKLTSILAILTVAALLAGCAGESKNKPADNDSKQGKQSEDIKKREAEDKKANELKIPSPDKENEKGNEPGEDKNPEPGEDKNPEPPKEPKGNGKIVVLDPGHSSIVTGGTEPIGPGASEYKLADTSGTSGVASGMPEYELVFIVSLQLKEELENRGYTVILTRESNDVPLSCIQRAEVANNAGADAFVRIHANGSSNQSARGAMTLCPTPNNPYIPELYEVCRRLADCVLDNLCEATGCVREFVWETDTMSGNNWSKVPVTLVEMGYMTNPEEDMLMQEPEYQKKIVNGIANGIDAFFGF